MITGHYLGRQGYLLFIFFITVDVEPYGGTTAASTTQSKYNPGSISEYDPNTLKTISWGITTSQQHTESGNPLTCYLSCTQSRIGDPTRLCMYTVFVLIWMDQQSSFSSSYDDWACSCILQAVWRVVASLSSIASANAYQLTKQTACNIRGNYQCQHVL